MIYFIYPGCSIAIWLLTGFLSQGFVFVYIEKILIYWIFGWITYNNIYMKITDLKSVFSCAKNLLLVQLMVGILFLLFEIALDQNIREYFYIHENLRNDFIILFIYFIINFISSCIALKLEMR